MIMNIYPQLNAFFTWVIHTSMLAGTMVILILIIKAVLGSRLKASWHYALWLLLILRLVIPAGPESSLSIYNLFSLADRPVNSAVAQHDQASTSGKLASSQQEVATPLPSPAVGAADSSVSAMQPDEGVSLHSILLTMWLGGVVLLLARLIFVNIRFSRLLGKYSYQADSASVQVLEEAKTSVKIKRRVTLMFSPYVSAPTLFGMLRPRIIMPVDARELSESQQKHIYLHELAHLKRWDILVNWMMHLLLAIHWFNPVLWYASYRMREDQELSADALALRRIAPGQVPLYGHTILTLLEKYTTDTYIPGAARLSASRKQLRRRIIMIKTFKRSSLGWTVIGLVLVLALSGCALTNGKTTGDTNASPPVDNTTPDTANQDGGNTSGGQLQGDNSADGSQDGESGSSQTANSGKGNASSAGGTTASTTTSNGSGSSKTTTTGHQKQIKEIVALAKQGKVKGADFVSGKTIIDDVHSSWGEPDRPWQPTDQYAYDSYSPGAGRGSYAFGIGRGEVVYDIRYFGSSIDESTDFKKISFKEIENTLGKPSSIKKSGNDDVLTYKEGNYELKFVGPHSTQRLDHISVYSPQAAKPMGGSEAGGDTVKSKGGTVNGGGPVANGK